MNARTRAAKPNRKDRMIHERVHDPYRNRRKLPEPTVCPKCNAVFLKGRWQWADSWPMNANRETCPACQRIEDGYPAGEVNLSGAFLQAHKAEILSLARHQETAEYESHPLHRIMGIVEQSESVTIRTTDMHLPRRIGEALHQAYQGDLGVSYDDAGCFVRVNWTRDS